MPAIRPELGALGETLPAALYLGQCLDRRLEPIRREVMSRIENKLFRCVSPPLIPEAE